jgi:1-acyl-sn-glycerol-3-phosphate acyltransferase
MPPEDVVLAPPNTVLKTSSGKIRRDASREIYEKGLVGKGRRAVWWQLVRFTAAGAAPWLRRARRRAAATLYAGYAWALFGLLAPLFGLVAAALPVERWRWSLLRAGAWLMAALAGIRVNVHGKEHLPPQDVGCIFVANHQSYLDGFLLAATLPRMFSFIAKGELQQSWAPRTLLNAIGAEFVERFDFARGVADAERIAARARAGRSLLFFAEGTFMRMPGLLPFRMGAFETAAHTGLPIVPVVIRGTRSILRSESWFPRRGAITVLIGEPIDSRRVADEAGGDDFKAAVRLRDLTRQRILRHCGEPDLAHERPPLLTRARPEGEKHGD